MDNNIEVIVEKKEVDVIIDKTLVEPNLQEKTATPTEQAQEITPDENYLLSKVIVKAIPEEYIIPEGEIEITENGNYNVKNYETANVNLPVEEPCTYDYTGTHSISNRARICRKSS